MNEVKPKKKSKRIFYFDALRAMAIICVILIHSLTFNRNGIFTAWTGPSLTWIVSEFLYNPMRIGVSLFLMLSGALSLGREWDIRSFLGKRFPRIIYPFVFWNAVFITLFIILSKYQVIHVLESFDFSSILNYIFSALNSDTHGFGANWFFWMILGTYLIMPIFNKWLLHADLKEAEYFLVIWLITCIFNFTLKQDFPVKLTYFTSPIGLVVLGYYLRYTERKILNNPYFALALFIGVGSLSTYLGYLFSSTELLFHFNRYSIFNSLMVISVFLLFKNFSKFHLKSHFSRLNKLIRKFVSALAKYSYGMYLIHYPLIFLLLQCIPKDMLPYKVRLTVTLLFAIFASMAILSVLNRVPYLKNIIGSK